jgi:putative flippase GtrA
MKDNIINRQRIMEFIRFGMVGTTAMIIHYGIYFVLLPLMDRNVAYTIGYFLSFLANFIMSSYFTFRVKPTTRRFIRFLSSHGVNYFVYLGLYNFFYWIGVPAELAPLPVYLIAVPISFLLVRLALKKKESATQ